MKRFGVFGGILISLVAQILLAVSPFIPYVRQNIWAAQTSVNGFASALATYIGIEFVCLSTLVLLFLFDIRNQTEDASARFTSLLHQYTPLQVRRLTEAEFYDDFLGSCVKAQRYVKICYFAPGPPERGAPPDRAKYYNLLARVIHKRPNTTFKRIIRDTPENREWAYELISQLIKATNCQVALLQDLNRDNEMPLALSVQVIDGREAWLVAIGEHTGADAHRDIAIENDVVVASLDRYFERLWAQSRVVFRPGDSLSNVRAALDEAK